jgi:hypothetical protein
MAAGTDSALRFRVPSLRTLLPEFVPPFVGQASRGKFLSPLGWADQQAAQRTYTILLCGRSNIRLAYGLARSETIFRLAPQQGLEDWLTSTPEPPIHLASCHRNNLDVRRLRGSCILRD